MTIAKRNIYGLSPSMKYIATNGNKIATSSKAIIIMLIRSVKKASHSVN